MYRIYLDFALCFIQKWRLPKSHRRVLSASGLFCIHYRSIHGNLQIHLSPICNHHRNEGSKPQTAKTKTSLSFWPTKAHFHGVVSPAARFLCTIPLAQAKRCRREKKAQWCTRGGRRTLEKRRFASDWACYLRHNRRWKRRSVAKKREASRQHLFFAFLSSG